MEDVQWLTVADDTRVAVSSVHRFGTDAILLSHFASPRPGETVYELGTGCGAIALRLCTRARPSAVHGVDIAPDAIDLARRSAAAFGGTPVPTFAVADWEDPATLGQAGQWRLVVCNPPYFAPGSGGVSEGETTRRIRHEGAHTLTAVCDGAARLLQYGGRFCLCHRPERLPAVLAALTAAGLTPKRLQTVHNREGQPPWLVLIEARKGGRPGLKWEPPLVLEEADGRPSAIYRQIYCLPEQEV